MEGVEPFLTSPAIPSTVNREILSDLKGTQYCYIRENLCCGCCTKSFDVYIATNPVLNYGELNKRIYNVKEEGCCDCSVCRNNCTRLSFYAGNDNSYQLWFTYPKCCDCSDCCNCYCLCCRCDCKCKCDCNCDCNTYSEPLIGYYGNTTDISFGQYRRQFYCWALCCAPTWIFYNTSNQDNNLKVKLTCYDYINPCSGCCKLNFDILRGENVIGHLTRSPACFCSGFVYEIVFPTDTTIEERLMLIALCCKAP